MLCRYPIWRSFLPNRLIALLLSAAIAGYPAYAVADQGDRGPLLDTDSAYSGDYLVIGAGGIVYPDYEGADEYSLGPAAGFRGRVSGISIFSRGIGIGADIMPDITKGRLDLSFGPVVRYRANRSGKVKDQVVRLLPELDSTVEAGFTYGVSLRKLLTPKDSLSVGGDVRWAVKGNRGGRIITTGISYFTPVSRAAAVGVAVGMDHVNRDYADYNYSIDAAGSAASGLPVFQARGGWKNIGGRIYAGYDLDGNLLNGGWGVGAMISYLRLRGSAAETPITSLRGDRGQWMGGIGVGYTF